MNDLDPRLRRLAERALAGIAVPSGPRSAATRRAPGVLVMAATTLVIVLAALGTGRFLSELRDQRAAASPPARPTTTAGRGIAPLPIIHRNTRFGYNLTLPAWLRHSEAETVWPQPPELDSREVFTARTPEEERRFLALDGAQTLGRSAVPWDLVVEVYERKGASSETWAAWLGCNWIGQPPPGAPPCTLGHTTLAGTSALVASSGQPLPGKMYLVERGPQLLVLRYSIGTQADRPADVSEALLEQIVRSVGLVEPGAAATAAPRVLGDRDVWPYLRSTLPAGAPIPLPRWLPDTIDREHVTVSSVSADPADPRFVITFAAPQGTIVYALGAADEIAGSGIGTTVRGQPATLTFATSLFNDPSAKAPRRVRWRENGHTLSITSDTFSGDDLLHIAWSLDPSGAPLRPFSRAAEGTCAKAGGSAEDTVGAYIQLLGSANTDALADCYANEVLGGANGSSAAQGGSRLPTARVVDIRRIGEVGGRVAVRATWAFASDPGGPWTMRPSKFFLLGKESGRWRIYEQGTAPFGTPP